MATGKPTHSLWRGTRLVSKPKPGEINNSNQSCFSGFPLTFSVFVSELEGLDQAQRFVHRAAHGQVIDGDLPQDALVVDHKQTSGRQTPRLQRCLAPSKSMVATATLTNAASPVRDSVIFLQDAVVFGDLLGEIGHEGDLHFTQTSLFSWRINPVKNKFKF